MAWVSRQSIPAIPAPVRPPSRRSPTHVVDPTHRLWYSGPVSPSQLSLGLQTPPALTREAFVVSSSNETAVHALDAWPDTVGGVLAIVGPTGSGKTHLLSAWAERTGAVLLDGELAALADLADLEGRLLAVD